MWQALETKARFNAHYVAWLLMRPTSFLSVVLHSFFFASQHNRLLILVGPIGCLLTAMEARLCSINFSKTRVCWLASGPGHWPKNVSVTSPTAPSSRCLQHVCNTSPGAG